ncbi:MAG TPA: DUF4276 family protein [bacterium]|nr:DUF4276 family protein [bacterium]
MVNEIRIYVEGGGDGKGTKSIVRKGFSLFLKELKSIARGKNIGWIIIACGPRGEAKNNYFTALKSHPDSFNVLLVDSEGPVKDIPWKHLKDRDRWDLDKSHNDNCHLMVQFMESWLIADVEALNKFYGHGFRKNDITKTQNVELISKQDINLFLNKATRNTSKGNYHKIRHGPKILELLNTSIVRSKASHCNHLFKTLAKKMNEAI